MPATNHIATAEERELHRKTCQTLYIGEGTKGLVKWGTIGAVLLTGAHFLWPRFRAVNYRIKVFAFGGFCSAGFAIAAEKAGILCARYPPWVLNSGSLPAPAAAEKPAA